MVDHAVLAERPLRRAARPMITLAIRAAPDPESLPRIMGLFAQRGLVPVQLCCRRGDQWLSIDVQFEEVEPQLTAILVEKLRALVLTDRVHVVTG